MPQSLFVSQCTSRPTLCCPFVASSSSVFPIRYSRGLGPGWWALPVSEALGNLPLVPASFQVLDLVMLFLSTSFFVAHLPLWSVSAPLSITRHILEAQIKPSLCVYSLINVYKTVSPPTSRRPLTSPRSTTRRNPSTTPVQAFAQLLPIIAFSILTVTWTFSPKSLILKDGHLEEYALIVCKSVYSSLDSLNIDSDKCFVDAGFLFGQLSSKIILAQLTRGPFPFSWSLLVPLLIPAIAINTPYLGLCDPSLFLDHRNSCTHSLFARLQTSPTPSISRTTLSTPDTTPLTCDLLSSRLSHHRFLLFLPRNPMLDDSLPEQSS